MLFNRENDLAYHALSYDRTNILVVDAGVLDAGIICDTDVYKRMLVMLDITESSCGGASDILFFNNALIIAIAMALTTKHKLTDVLSEEEALNVLVIALEKINTMFKFNAIAEYYNMTHANKEEIIKIASYFVNKIRYTIFDILKKHLVNITTADIIVDSIFTIGDSKKMAIQYNIM